MSTTAKLVYNSQTQNDRENEQTVAFNENCITTSTDLKMGKWYLEMRNSGHGIETAKNSEKLDKSFAMDLTC